MGAPVSDIIIEDDLVIIDGDFYVDLSDNMHVRDIFRLDMGQSRQFPLLGIGINRQNNGCPSIASIKQTVRRNLTADNIQVESLSAKGEMNISVSHKRLL